jgi:hypothetical protein
METAMKLRVTMLAVAVVAGLSACSSGVDGTYCIADAGKLVFKGGKVATDKGDAAGTYVSDSQGIVFTDKFGIAKRFNREADGSFSGDYALKPCK